MPFSKGWDLAGKPTAGRGTEAKQQGRKHYRHPLCRVGRYYPCGGQPDRRTQIVEFSTPRRIGSVRAEVTVNVDAGQVSVVIKSTEVMIATP
jgi:hypothetical protein